MKSNTALSKSESTSLLADVEEHFRKYVVTEQRHILVVSLWAIATHLFHSFDAFAYLAITSPTKRCGKTRLAELLEMVSFNPWRTVGATPAVIFRTVDKDRPTLIMDEAEILNTKEERAFALREVLNAGYRKGQTVSRCDERNGHEPRKFKTYCPKAFVLIGSLSGALSDRCIEIKMRRRWQEKIERFRFARVLEQSKPLKKTIASWANNQGQSLAAWYQENGLEFLEDREEELWLPLFAVCAALAPDRLPELKRVALDMAGQKNAGEPSDWGISLLQDIRLVFCGQRMATSELITALHSLDNSPWRGWNQGRGMSARDIARLLRPFAISPRNMRQSNSVSKGYLATDFRDAWERYLPQDAVNDATPLHGA